MEENTSTQSVQDTKSVQPLVAKVQAMLQEEKWTRATINNFTKTNLNALADIVAEARKSRLSLEVQNICDERLANAKDSITALYISGMLSMYDGVVDNYALAILVDILKKNHRTDVIKDLCKGILDEDPNNKFALRTMAANCEEDEKWALYAQIVKIDYEEADMAKALAERAESLAASEGDAEKAERYKKEAVSYYKKALLRYIGAKNTTSVKPIWGKLVSLIPTDFDFFKLAKNKIAKAGNDDLAIDLMKDLYEWYKANEKYDIAIEILKQNLDAAPDDKSSRREIRECYEKKYADRENVREYISKSFSADSRNIFECINEFEKHIAFDAGNYVYHRQWRVGKIKKAESGMLVVSFGKKFGIRKISMKMAVEALKPLTEGHIWVLKATMKRDDLAKKIKNDKNWALETIIRSFDNNCDMKRIKAELVTQSENSLLTPGEWTSWSSAAKKILASNPIFSVNPNDSSFYTVREKMSQDAKLFNEFKAEKKFDERVKILLKYLDNEECGLESDSFDPTAESLGDMIAYFSNFLKAPAKIGENEIVSFLLLEHISSISNEIPINLKSSFEDLYRRIEDPREIYKAIKATSAKDDKRQTSLRQEFLEKIKKVENAADEYIRLFPVIPEKWILQTLVASNSTEKVKKLVQDCFENYRANKKAVIFLFSECRNETWFEEANIPYEKQLIALVSIIEQSFREINNHVDTTENKKRIKEAADLLFGDEKKPGKDTGALIAYIMEKDETTVSRIYTLVNDIVDLQGNYKQTLREKILEKYPKFKFPTTVEKAENSHRGTLVTAKKLAEKEARIKELQNVELPAIGKEIAEARAQGDLKENAEYQAAKEKQHMLNLEQTRLQQELNRAQVFDPTTIDTSIVSFGTTVRLLNNNTNSEDIFTIMGPWESDTENGIISYMSPLGSQLLNMHVGDSKNFTINETEYDYLVKSIEAAKI